MKKPITYLACPYTDANREVREFRFRSATLVAAEMIRGGRVVYSPITMTHPLDALLAGEAQTLGSDFWLNFDRAFMDACDDLAVLTLAGWEESQGVQREIAHFVSQGKPVEYLKPPLSLGNADSKKRKSIKR
jgi:hypothetical protein